LKCAAKSLNHHFSLEKRKKNNEEQRHNNDHTYSLFYMWKSHW